MFSTQKRKLSDESGKNILSLLDNKGLYQECTNLQIQSSVVAKAENKLQKDG